MAAGSETGAQLFARLGEKPSLDRLDSKLFHPSCTPSPGDVVELYGASGCGKTEMLLNMTATCLLPEMWDGICIGGLGTGVIFLDTDHQFSMLRLLSILECKVNKAVANKRARKEERIDNTGCDSKSEVKDFATVKKSGNDGGSNRSIPAHERKSMSSSISKTECKLYSVNDHELQNKTKGVNVDKHDEISDDRVDESFFSPDDEQMESFVKGCLKKLYVVRILSSDQLAVTLHSLESLLASQSDISVVMLDSVSAFYWLDKMNSGDSVHLHEANQKLAFAALSRLLHDYHLVAFVTKTALISKRLYTDLRSYNDNINVPSPSNNSVSAGTALKLGAEHFEFMSKEWSRLVTHRILLERQDCTTPVPVNGVCVSNIFILILKSKVLNYTCTHQFTVTAEGVIYL